LLSFIELKANSGALRLHTEVDMRSQRGLGHSHVCDSLLLFYHHHSSRVHKYEPNPGGTTLSHISDTSAEGSEKYRQTKKHKNRHVAATSYTSNETYSIFNPPMFISIHKIILQSIRTLYTKRSNSINHPLCFCPPTCRSWHAEHLQCATFPKCRVSSMVYLMYRGNCIAFVALARVHCMLFRRRGSRPIAALAPGRGFRSSIPKVSSHGWTLRSDKFYCISMQHFQASRLCRYARRHNSEVQPLDSQPASPSSRSLLSQLGSRTRKRGS
jgi:hypothetical protein